MPVYSEKLKCTVKALTYDFETRIGEIKAPSANLSNMAAVIRVFRKIDEDVVTIKMTAFSEVQNKHYPITFYRQDNGLWSGKITYDDGMEMGPDDVHVD